MLEERISPNPYSNIQQSNLISPPRITSLRSLTQVPMNYSPELFSEQDLRRQISSPVIPPVLMNPHGNMIYNPQIPVAYPVIIQQQSPTREYQNAIFKMVKKQNHLLETIAGQVNNQAQQLMKNEAKLLQSKLNKFELERQMDRKSPNLELNQLAIGSQIVDWRESLMAKKVQKKENLKDRLYDSPLVNNQKKIQIFKEKERKKKPTIGEFIQDYNTLDQLIKNQESN